MLRDLAEKLVVAACAIFIIWFSANLCLLAVTQILSS